MSSLTPQSYPTPDGNPSLPVEGTQALPASNDPTSDERTMAMLAELLQLFSGIIGPIIIFFVKRESKFVRFHALQAVLWQTLLILLYIAFFAAFILAMIISGKNHPPLPGQQQPLPWLIVVVWIFFMLAGLTNMVFAIYYGVKANGGHWSRYPIIGRIAGHYYRP